jgi:hypothetical protein
MATVGMAGRRLLEMDEVVERLISRDPPEGRIIYGAKINTLRPAVSTLEGIIGRMFLLNNSRLLCVYFLWIWLA